MSATPPVEPIVLENTPCPRCASTTSSRKASGADHLYGVPGLYFAAECDGCGLWFQNPRPRADDLARLYPDHYLPYRQLAPEEFLRGVGRRFLIRRLGYRHPAISPVVRLPPLQRWTAGVRLVPRFIDGGRLLEIGCASGTFLRAMRALGWHGLRGIEMVQEAAGRARDDGFDIVNDTAEGALSSESDATYDVVVASMVLEHLLDPFVVIDAAARILRPGGQFLFSTVIRGSLDERIYGSFWAGYDFPRHMVYFTREDLLNALSRWYAPVEIYYEAEPVDFVRSSSWRLREGKASMLDRAIVSLANGVAGTVLLLPLAFAGLTSRVSFRCRRL